MFIKIQSCINLTTTKKEKKFRSTAEKVSNGFLHFISQFNVSIQRKKFSFYRSTTKNFFFSSQHWTSLTTITTSMRKWGKFLHVSFYFLMVFYSKRAAWKVFLVVAAAAVVLRKEIIDKINWQYEFNFSLYFQVLSEI